MPEKCLCEIPEAYVTKVRDRYHAGFYFSGNEEALSEPFMQDEGYAMRCLDHLRVNRSARIATPEHPILPPSAGVLDVLVDSEGDIKHIVMFEKDKGSPRTPGYHTPFHGYPSEPQEWGLFKQGYREAAEEVLYVTDGEVLHPEAGEAISMSQVTKLNEKARKLGYDLDLSEDDVGLLPADFPMIEGYDKMVFFNRKLDSSVDYNGSFSWFPYVDFIKVRAIRLPIEGTMVYDLEGFWRDAVLIEPENLKEKVFGDVVPATVMENPKDETGIPVPGPRTVREKEITFQPIPILKATLHDMRIYPHDWMDEL